MSDTAETASLDDLTLSAFCENAINSAVLIDEQFPKLSDALRFEQLEDDHSALVAQYPEWHIASELYDVFNSLQIVCDVENEPNKLGELPDRIAKADLVILDLHLRTSDDQSDSIAVLQSLSKNDKFNIVVVYTKDEDLRNIAIGLAGSIRGKTSFDDATWEVAFSAIRDDYEKHELPIEEMAISYISGSIPTGDKVGKLRGHMSKEHSLGKDGQDAILESLAAFFLQKHYGSIPNQQRILANSQDFKSINPWMVFPNVFVVVANKKATQPSQILPVVKEAIVSWKPSIVRTIICQLQNTLARSGYAFADSLADDIDTQIAWLFHACQISDGRPQAIEMLIERVALSLRSMLSRDSHLHDFVSSCISRIQISVGVESQLEALSELFNVAAIDNATVMHALNCFESTEEFSTDYVTTGTVLFSNDETHGSRWWLCVEPACDTVPTQASSQDKFLSCRLLELRNCTKDKENIVRRATRSRYVFVKFNSKREFLDVLNETSNQPRPVTAFVRKELQVSDNEDGKQVSIFFPNKTGDSLEFTEVEMCVVAQLQQPYANRFLQETGNQLSRIGLDFVDLPGNVDAELQDGKGN